MTIEEKKGKYEERSIKILFEIKKYYKIRNSHKFETVSLFDGQEG